MREIKKITGILFVFIGLILVCTPFYYEWKQGQEVAALQEALSMISESDGDSVNTSSINSFSTAELEKILELEIPAIDLKQMVLPETTEENLSVALTQIKTNQTPGEGNFAIAGHRGYRGDRHFRQLPDVPMGAEVFLYHGDQKFVYEITTSAIIEATDVDILDDQENESEITLITCTIDGKQRIALTGDLVSSE